MNSFYKIERIHEEEHPTQQTRKEEPNEAQKEEKGEEDLDEVADLPGNARPGDNSGAPATETKHDEGDRDEEEERERKGDIEGSRGEGDSIGETDKTEGAREDDEKETAAVDVSDGSDVVKKTDLGVDPENSSADVHRGETPEDDTIVDGENGELVEEAQQQDHAGLNEEEISESAESIAAQNLRDLLSRYCFILPTNLAYIFRSHPVTWCNNL